MIKKIALTISLLGILPMPAYSQDQKTVTLAQSQPYVATSDAAQHFSESIDIAKGQEKLQMTMTYYNGSATAPGFKWLRISSPSMNYITERTFDGQKTCSEDVTGDLTWGGNQILITGAGPKGATFGWRLTSQKPSITSISPTQLSPGGTLTVTGTNLCPDVMGNSVLIGGKPAHCLSASADKLTVQVPEDVKGGDNAVQVTSANMNAGSITCAVNAFPYLKSLSAAWFPPGGQLTIYGEGFSSDPSKITVYIGPLLAPVVSCTANSITVSGPANFGGEPWGYYQPIRVTVNGVKARNKLTVSCSYG